MNKKEDIKRRKLGRRDFVARIGAGALALAAADRTEIYSQSGQDGVVLENSTLRLAFDKATGRLTGLQNKLCGQTLYIEGDKFRLIAAEFNLTPENMPLASLRKKTVESVEATYAAEGRQVIVTYTLEHDNQFVEKTLAITSPSAFSLNSLVISSLRFSGSDLKMVKYPHLQNVTYFGRSDKGGIFLGLELPFDNSSLDADGTVKLGYKPSLKVKAGERLESEPVYLGAYRRRAEELEEESLPLRSESQAMVAMTSAIMGPPRHGLLPVACGWWCEFQHETYQTEAQVEVDMRSLDLLAECGIDWITDSQPWCGEIDEINTLGQDGHYSIGPLPARLFEYATKKNVKVVFWPTMTNTDPWWKQKGKPFRSDRPDWTMYPEGQTVTGQFVTGRVFTRFLKGNCLGNRPFFDWLMRLQLEGLGTGYFPGWVMDGDFFGGGGAVIPVNCPSAEHDHLPGDSNYACERALKRMMAAIRGTYPEIFMGPMCRPAMDLGIWSNRDADSIFTLDEFAQPIPLAGMGPQPVNVTMGDKLRKWSRVRVHHHFFPHYMDHPLVFAAPKSMKGPDWASEKIDYVMLSALSSSPAQLYYLPTKAGIPDRDKKEIRKWLDWGRQNIRYLQVRRDLPDWPEAGKVDGSAHICEDRGFIFLFNPNSGAYSTRFRLDHENIGISQGSEFEISQIYPSSTLKENRKLGDDVGWNVPPQSAVVLWIASIDPA